MTITLNGDTIEVAPATRLSALLEARLSIAEPKGVAVAIDGVVVPASQWSTTDLEANASVEVLKATAGG